MLKITVPKTEVYNEETEKFEVYAETELQLEHSLVSLAAWESKWERPFLGKGQKTTEETIDYIRQMTLTKDVPENVFYLLTSDNLVAINRYIEAKMTATTFSATPAQGPSRSTEVITAEIIYYWMVALQIPFECQHWHLERLLTLIKVTNLKNQPDKKKKMSRSELLSRNRQLNAERRANLKTRG